MAYSFFLDGVQLPVPPSKLQVKINNQNKTMTLINEGQFNVLKKPGLSEISFTMMLPQIKYPFSVYPEGFKPATYYAEKLEALKVNQKPFPFVVSRISPRGELLFDTNFMVALEEYTINEDVEEGLDLLVDVKLKQYVWHGTKMAIVEKSTDGSTAKVVKIIENREVTKEIPESYVVKQGDTTYSISKSQLGDGSKHGEIENLNGITSPNQLAVGSVIKLA